MYTQRDFSPASPGEDEPYGFNFRTGVDLVAGEVIADAVFSIVAVKGTDVSATSRLVGMPTVDGTKVSQRVANLAAGVRYKISCLVTTSAGNKRLLFSFVDCEA